MAEVLERGVGELHGVGKKRGEQLGQLGIRSLGELLYHFPRDYEDWSEILPVALLTEGETAVAEGRVTGSPAQWMSGSGKRMVTVPLADETGALQLIFFHDQKMHYFLKQNKSYRVRGKPGAHLGGKSMFCPSFYPADQFVPLLPRYPLTQGITGETMTKLVRQALALLEAALPDQGEAELLPWDLREAHDLPSLVQALQNIHFPENREVLAEARRRFAFEELLTLQLGMLQIKEEARTENRHPIPRSYPAGFAKRLPYALTGAQVRSIKEVIADMAGESTMNRLIQGDVGSGKTAVAAAVSWAAIRSGMQVAFMAPTELLAQQHYQSLSKMMGALDRPILLLTGSTGQAEKRRIYDLLETGAGVMAVGTHALFSEKLKFRNLGLVITDEQHRFGVTQRGALARKGASPHLLVMSATPIPRTLSLMLYGELSVSVLDEMPPGRQAIETYLVDGTKRLRVFGYVQKHLDQGRQGYFICPLVAEDEKTDWAAVESYGALVRRKFPGARVGILHGRMKAAEKETVMQGFSA